MRPEEGLGDACLLLQALFLCLRSLLCRQQSIFEPLPS
jgi:hypothetical protein